MSEGRRARPQPTPETQHFWDGTREGELRLQRCNACGKVYFPPRPFCPACASREISVFSASGKYRGLALTASGSGATVLEMRDDLLLRQVHERGQLVRSMGRGGEPPADRLSRRLGGGGSLIARHAKVLFA